MSLILIYPCTGWGQAHTVSPSAVLTAPSRALYWWQNSQAPHLTHCAHAGLLPASASSLMFLTCLRWPRSVAGRVRAFLAARRQLRCNSLSRAQHPTSVLEALLKSVSSAAVSSHAQIPAGWQLSMPVCLYRTQSLHRHHSDSAGDSCVRALRQQHLRHRPGSVRAQQRRLLCVSRAGQRAHLPQHIR